MPTTPAQLIEQASRHISMIERLKSHDVNVLRDTVRRIETTLLGRLARNDISTWSRTRAETQLAYFSEFLASEYQSELLPLIWQQIDELGIYEAGFEVRSLGSVTVNFDYRLPTDNQVMTAIRVNPLSVRGPDNGSLLEPFLESWSQRQVAATTGAIRAGFAQGQTTGEVIRNLRDVVFPANDNGLGAVVRTALQHSANQARQATWAANSDIVKRVRWLSTLDSRTSEQCQSMDGRLFPINEGPRPPLHISCLAGHTDILTCGGVSNIYKRSYKGAMVDIKTASGRTLTITPNHPILTRTGWKPAGEVNALDSLACVTRPQDIISNNKDCVNARFSDLFSAAKIMVDPSSVAHRPSATEHFHGDGVANTDIEVIDTTSLRWDGVREMLNNSIKNDRLPLRSGVKYSLYGLGSLNPFLSGCFSAFTGFVRGFSEACNLLWRRVIHANLLLLRPVSQGSVSGAKEPYYRSGGAIKAKVNRYGIGSYAGLVSLANFISNRIREINNFELTSGGVSPVEHSLDWLEVNAEQLPDFLDGRTFGAEFDHVVDVTVRKEVFCHVFNLENENNWYVANGIITHNCRSSTVAVLDDRYAFLDEGATRSARDPETGKVESVPAKQSYYQWLAGQPAAVQDSIIGPTRGKLLRDGGLSAQRFSELSLGKNFQPLTLDQMRELDPVAFIRAGLD
jgi:SPP1 gp7 family putative phage head morphogenesis protein